MGLSLVEAREIRDTIDAAGVRSVVGFTTSFTPAIQTLLRLGDNGQLGTLRSIWSRRTVFIPPETMPAWRRDPATSGGLLYEITIHELEWMLRLGGEVDSVVAVATAENATAARANDHVWVQLRFANSVIGSHEGSWQSALPCFNMGVCGSLGAATTDEWGNSVYFASNGGERESLVLSRSIDLRAQFLDCIQTGESSLSDVHWGYQVMELADLVLRAVRTGKVESVATESRSPVLEVQRLHAPTARRKPRSLTRDH